VSPLRVLITDHPWPDLTVERQLLSALGAELVEAPNGDESTLIELARDVDAIGTCWAKVTEAVIAAAPRLRVVARYGIGLDNIAVPAASERGIPVTYVPDYCVEEVADHTLALLLACLRKVGFYHLRTKQGEYQLQAGSPLRRLSKLTLGLIGFGRIGQEVFRRARGLGLSVIAYSPSGNDRGSGCRMVSLDEVLEQSDAVSLHLPLADETRRLIGMSELRRMRRSAWLINTSRGGLVDHAALWSAIESGEIAGAGLDVFDPEPPDLAEALYRDERVIVTPHAAFLSEESLADLRQRATASIVQVLQGLQPEHLANPHVYKDPHA
jgi:D-3-phosphoglycerate dehydrogenase